jgi:hypothetical protein
VYPVISELPDLPPTDRQFGCGPERPVVLRNRYVLTGDAEGDYNVTLTMVSTRAAPAL